MAHARNGGIALLAVLWASILLAMIGAALLAATRTETRVARNVVDAARARAAAEAGVSLAILALVDGPEEERPRGDGTPALLPFADARLWIAIQDEGGKINLNLAAEELLRGAFRAGGVDEAQALSLAQAVLDWRDEDGVRRPSGAEDESYRAAPYLPRNAAFEAVGELRLVLGMTPDLFERVADLFTVSTRQAVVDLGTAPRDVLMSLPGVAASDVERLLEARDAAPRQAGARGRAALPPLPGAGRFAAQRPSEGVFTIRAQATTESGSTYVSEALVRIQRQAAPPYTILSQRQSDRPLLAPSP